MISIAVFGIRRSSWGIRLREFEQVDILIRRMASIPHSPAAFVGASASDLLRSSSNGISGVPLRTLGRGQFGARRSDFAVVAKIRKVKKHEHPWPDNADPNVKGGVLSHLSHFKPLKEKPKPVTLEFERPLLDLEKKIIDVNPIYSCYSFFVELKHFQGLV